MVVLTRGKLFIIIGFFLVVLLSANHIPSNERGNNNYRRDTNIDVNLTRATIFNWGYTGKYESEGVSFGYGYEWPVNSGNEYIWLTGLSVGAEIINDDGQKDALISTVLRNDASGRTLSWEPVKEYLNSSSNKIAISDDPNSWPEFWPDKMEDGGWPGSWNGYFGKDKYSAEQEIFYKISDDYNNSAYTPDSSDISRKGLGLLADVRVMQWKQILIEDIVFQLFDIKNDGTEDLDKVAFSLWYADYIGGDGNDQLSWDLASDVAFNWDPNHISDDPPYGYVSISYLETPGNNIDRIDNDGDSTPENYINMCNDYNGTHNCEIGGPYITQDMVDSETELDGIDNNGNGLIDENASHVDEVTYADRIDNDGDGEDNSPLVDYDMISEASSPWKIWPPPLENNGIIHLIGIDDDYNKIFADGIDNDGDGLSICSNNLPYVGCELGSPLVDSLMIGIAIQDNYGRFFVQNENGDTLTILYDLGYEDLGLPYADGIDNDLDGIIDEGIDENIDEMIDESRDDLIDNDGDWTLEDDLGINGDGFNFGANDNTPTSGSGTGFPGEPNIDKTDVSESDQMGLTSVVWKEENSGINTKDQQFWSEIMTPGNLTPLIQGVDNDLFVSSGYFPLKAGQTERIAMAISFGWTQSEALENRNWAQDAYESDYQFAKSPIPPNVVAVPGDGKVTLYWDSVAELSEDLFMSMNYGESYKYDFEGYKIYRSTDWQFSDSYIVTDGDGSPTFHKPYILDGNSCQWDINNEINGWHPVDVNGVQFYLGDNTGLQHSFVDTDVINGQTYYYAVVSYDSGGPEDSGIMPSDSPMRLRVNSLSGEMELGPNVVSVTPIQPSAGFLSSDIKGGDIKHLSGTSSGKIYYNIIDPMKIVDQNKYQITFEDTITIVDGDTIKTTKSYYLTDITNDLDLDTLFFSDNLPINDGPVIDGFQLYFQNVDDQLYLNIDNSNSFWSQDSIWNFNIDQFDLYSIKGTKMPHDYRIIFSSTVDFNSQSYSISSSCCDSKSVNYFVQKQVNYTGNDAEDWETINTFFIDGQNPEGFFNATSNGTDWIVFLDAIDSNGDEYPSWRFNLEINSFNIDSLIYDQPGIYDTAYIYIHKPFSSLDIYEFTTMASYVDPEIAKSNLNNIYVVPNPYIAANAFEAENIYSNGRGPREIQFRNLPAECIIRIYTVSGELVQTIFHNTSIDNGMVAWDLLTKDNLSVSYGIYIYHIEAPGIGEHIGKLALIK